MGGYRPGSSPSINIAAARAASTPALCPDGPAWQPSHPAGGASGLWAGQACWQDFPFCTIGTFGWELLKVFGCISFSIMAAHAPATCVQQKCICSACRSSAEQKRMCDHDMRHHAHCKTEQTVRSNEDMVMHVAAAEGRGGEGAAGTLHAIHLGLPNDTVLKNGSLSPRTFHSRHTTSNTSTHTRQSSFTQAPLAPQYLLETAPTLPAAPAPATATGQSMFTPGSVVAISHNLPSRARCSTRSSAALALQLLRSNEPTYKREMGSIHGARQG